jgi:hypothetical protein
MKQLVLVASLATFASASALPFIGHALAQNSLMTMDSLENLVADIKAHDQGCANVQPSQIVAYNRCEHEEGTLLERQHRLGASDDVIKSKLETRKWRWPYP